MSGILLSSEPPQAVQARQGDARGACGGCRRRGVGAAAKGGDKAQAPHRRSSGSKEAQLRRGSSV